MSQRKLAELLYSQGVRASRPLSCPAIPLPAIVTAFACVCVRVCKCVCVRVCVVVCVEV